MASISTSHDLFSTLSLDVLAMTDCPLHGTSYSYRLPSPPSKYLNVEQYSLQAEFGLACGASTTFLTQHATTRRGTPAGRRITQAMTHHSSHGAAAEQARMQKGRQVTLGREPEATSRITQPAPMAQPAPRRPGLTLILPPRPWRPSLWGPFTEYFLPYMGIGSLPHPAGLLANSPRL